MKRGWLGAKLGCSGAKNNCLQRDERWVFRARGFGDGSILNGFIAGRASMGRSAGLQLHILETKITACLYIFNK